MSWVAQMEGDLASASKSPVPEGFKTSHQIASELGLTHSGAIKKIRAWVSAGTVTVRQFRATSGQVNRPIPHYCLTKSLPKNFKR